MPSHRRWSISAVTSLKAASARHTFCRLRSGREPGTRVHTIPNPFATSIAAAYSTTCVLSSATSAPSPPCTGTAPRAPSPALLFFAFFFPADIAASLSLETGRNQLPGERRGKKPNLTGVLEGDSTPARMIAPSARLSCGHESARQNTASRAACQDHATNQACRHRFTAAPAQPQRSRLDNPPAIGHPGTGHGAGRRTGSTPVAANAGP